MRNRYSLVIYPSNLPVSTCKYSQVLAYTCNMGKYLQTHKFGTCSCKYKFPRVWESGSLNLFVVILVSCEWK